MVNITHALFRLFGLCFRCWGSRVEVGLITGHVKPCSVCSAPGEGCRVMPA